MNPLLLTLVVVFLLLLTASVAFVLSRRFHPVPALSEPKRKLDVDHAALRAASDERGTELLERRVLLDLRRGTLGGDDYIDEALQALDTRFKANEISEAEYEAEKIRLLSG